MISLPHREVTTDLTLDPTTTAMATVYLIAQPTVSRRDGRVPDISPLSEYGTVRIVLPVGEHPNFNPERCLRIVRSVLAEFNPELDYLAWAGGDTLAAVMAGIVLHERGLPDFRWLRYERPLDRGTGRRTDKGAKYLPTRVSLSEDQLELFNEES